MKKNIPFISDTLKGIHLYYNVVVVLGKHKQRYVTKLGIIGWLCPLILVSITLICEKYTNVGYHLEFEYYDPDKFEIAIEDSEKQELTDRINFYVSPA